MNARRPLNESGVGLSYRARRITGLNRLEPGRKLVQFDELIRIRIIAGMSDEDVFPIQRFYPQVYLACHADHVRAGSTKWRLQRPDGARIQLSNLLWKRDSQ